MSKVILERIASSLERLGSYQPLGGDRYESEMESCLEAKQSPDYLQSKERAIHDVEPDAVRLWLRTLPIANQDEVVVLWPAFRFGISTSYRGFVEAYDELWLPSADDIWVRPPLGNWLLELHHEEMLRFFARTETRPASNN